ncbi:MAG: hypothetical protein RRY36_03045 [Bacteroidaceae bacterium]
MKSSSIGLLFVLLVSSSCDKEDSQPQPEEKVIWEQAHTCLLHFEGNPLLVTSSQRSGDGAYMLDKTYKFDEEGRLLDYDPTGNEQQGASTFMGQWGTPENSTKYTYAYDTKGRLITVVAQSLGSEAATYSLTYDTHQVYIPCPLPLADLPLYLIKGLSKVERTDDASQKNPFVYIYDGEKASSQTTTWMGTTTTEYTFKGMYPYKCVKKTSRAEMVLQQEETLYAFGELGALLAETTITTTDVPEEKTTTSLTYAKPWLLVRQATITAGMSTERYEYTYSEKGLLTSANKTSGEESASIAVSPYIFDDKGNATKADYTVNGLFYDYLPEGTITLNQTFSYK